MRKVYCSNCKFYQGMDVSGIYFQGNLNEKGPEIVIDCVRPKVSGYGNSRLMNKNNDCADYKRKKWWKFWGQDPRVG